MTVQASIAINYVADSAADVEALVAGLSLPEGAFVSASVVEQVVQGTVQSGAVAPIETAMPAPEPTP
jgi:hypothetical protein